MQPFTAYLPDESATLALGAALARARRARPRDLPARRPRRRQDGAHARPAARHRLPGHGEKPDLYPVGTVPRAARRRAGQRHPLRPVPHGQSGRIPGRRFSRRFRRQEHLHRRMAGKRRAGVAATRRPRTAQRQRRRTYCRIAGVVPTGPAMPRPPLISSPTDTLDVPRAPPYRPENRRYAAAVGVQPARARRPDPGRARLAGRRLHARHAGKRHQPEGRAFPRARSAAPGGRHRRPAAERHPEKPGRQDRIERPLHQAGAGRPEPPERGAPGVRPEGRNQAAGIHAGAGGGIQAPPDLRPVSRESRRPDRRADRKGRMVARRRHGHRGACRAVAVGPAGRPRSGGAPGSGDRRDERRPAGAPRAADARAGQAGTRSPSRRRTAWCAW